MIMTAETYTPAKWFRCLLILALASHGANILDQFLDAPLLFTLVDWAIVAGNLYCLFNLATAHSQYRLAGLLKGATLALSVVATALVHFLLLPEPANIVNYINMPLTIMAAAFVLLTHSRFFAGIDRALSKNWMLMLILYLLGLVITTGGSTVINHITVNSGTTWLLSLLLNLCAGYSKVVSILITLTLLKSTLTLQKAEKTE